MDETTFQHNYEVKQLIGSGGMSLVYLVEHKRLHTLWAAKQVSKQQMEHFDFLAESNILKRLEHPMLPRIVDIFEDHEFVYIIEDYVRGDTLENLLHLSKKIDEVQGLQWFRDLCDVLIFLHNQKPHPIIYRDLKPKNIMIQPDGSLKLIDFGIAREYKQEASSDTIYAGTEGYAAPEQFGTAQTDARTDIYSLGVTMYHILTGKSPFEPPYDFVPVRQLVPNLSHGTECILGKCIQMEPEARYQSVEELLYDLEHIYRFDHAWKKFQHAKLCRILSVACLFAVSIGLMVSGWVVMGQEKEAEYISLLSQASGLYETDYDRAIADLEAARALYPDRIEPDRQQTYALYCRGKWQECADYGKSVLLKHGEDSQTLLIVASALFELGEYQDAAQDFYQGSQNSELSVDHMRDYAVCLGRLGRIDEAAEIVEELQNKGGNPEVTSYVQGEILFAKKDYLGAESAFFDVLQKASSDSLVRRCYLSLGNLYRECTALTYTNQSPIQNPASKSIEVLSQGISQEALYYDTSFWEMLAMSYFEAYHTEDSSPAEYLTKAAEYFNRVIELGVTNDYLYSNLYTIYYQQGDYTKAAQILTDYEERFPEDYMPHALRGILLITQENQKEQAQRNYQPAVREYETAGQMLRSSDNKEYYQQLENLIVELRNSHWI